MSDYFDRVEQQLVHAVETRTARRSRLPVRGEHLALVAGILVVLVVAAVFAATRGRGTSGSPGRSEPFTVVFTASPPLRMLDRDVATLRLRLAAVFRGAEVSRAGSRILVSVPAASHPTRARIATLAAPGRLFFYDWEANVLTPGGGTVAAGLGGQDRDAVTISQGSGSAAPGAPGVGSMNLYTAVKLAARQPLRERSDNSTFAAQFYLFGAPNSSACATAAAAGRTIAAPGVHCLLAGPADSRLALRAGVPASIRGTEELVVKPGTVIVQATNSSPGEPIRFADPRAQFYVVRDHVSLFGNEVRDPRAGTDQGGNPDVTFSFTRRGTAAFQHVTATLAHRGALVSGLGAHFNQHFAIALDGALLTVPQIDFKSYPDGIRGAQGADITGGLTTQGARGLAAILRFGPLPVPLTAR